MKKTALSVLITFAIGPAIADDFTDTLESARQAYEEGDISGAREEMVYGTQLLSQMRALSLQEFLPKAMDGWERKDTKNRNNARLSVMGGGTTAVARYRNGKKNIKISIIADSPMIQGLSMLFSNPALAGAQGTMKRIERQKVLVKPDGSISTLLNKRISVEITGRAPVEDKEAYFKEIDFKGLKAF